MRTSASQLARLALLLAVAGCLLSAGGAGAKPDKKKSLAAMKRGRKADQAGESAEAWRARGRDYQAVDDRQKALADFDQAIELKPGDPENYLARGDFFAAIKQTERAIHDYTVAINLHLERTDVYAARGKAYTEARQFDKAEEDLTQAIKLRLDNAEP